MVRSLAGTWRDARRGHRTAAAAAQGEERAGEARRVDITAAVARARAGGGVGAEAAAGLGVREAARVAARDARVAAARAAGRVAREVAMARGVLFLQPAISHSR